MMNDKNCFLDTDMVDTINGLKPGNQNYKVFINMARNVIISEQQLGGLVNDLIKLVLSGGTSQKKSIR